jgi:hypothetical protein
MTEHIFRYERKFVTDIQNLADVHRFIQLSPLRFYKPYEPRRISNMYCDTMDFWDYHSHVNGVCSRQKHRVRWYGDDINTVHSPGYEIKIKEGNVGTKERFILDKSYSLKEFINNHESILRNNRPEDGLLDEFLVRKPVMINSYKREYFVSQDNKIRLTVDTDLKYYSIGIDGKISSFPTEDPVIVIEMKYDPENDPLAQAGSNDLPFRSNAKSKYVTGLEFLNLV